MVNVIVGMLVLGGGVFVITMLGSLVMNLVSGEGFKFKQHQPFDYVIGVFVGVLGILCLTLFVLACHEIGIGILNK